MKLALVIGMLVLFFAGGIALVLGTDIGNQLFAGKESPKIADSAAKPPVPAVAQPAAQVERTNFNDWLLLCQSQQPNRNCALVQQHISGEAKNFVFAVTMRSPEEGKLEAEFTTPSNVLLEPGLTLKLDEEAPLKFRFIQCSTTRCVAAASLNGALLDRLLKAEKLTASFQTAAGQELSVNISKSGLSQGVAALRG